MGQGFGDFRPVDRNLYERLEKLERMVSQFASGRSLKPDEARPDTRLDNSQLYYRPMHPPATEAPPATSFTAGRAKMVRKLLRKRRQRDNHFGGDIFADPAWDMLLDLYAAHYERNSVSVSSLCIAAAVPATTALRWIKMMTDTGQFLRHADTEDGRRIFIRISEEARAKMDAYFDDVEDR
jgi:DNA-binding MarR family transcriptional regulator